MNKAQRKARLKRIKQNQKEQKRRAQGEAGTGAPGSSERVDVQADKERPTASRPAPDNDTNDLKAKLADAKHLAREAKSDALTDRQARAMLVRAANFLDEVIAETRERLKTCPPEMQREAEEILAEEAMQRHLAQTVGVKMAPHKRPRRAPNPAVTLMKLGKEASSLLHRILRVTNPNIAKMAA